LRHALNYLANRRCYLWRLHKEFLIRKQITTGADFCLTEKALSKGCNEY
jgi:hypothetical protein